MPIKKESTTIPAINSLVELLVALQLDGHLENATLPGWASSTTVAEVFEALKVLGDGEWLDGVYDDLGFYESADQWLRDFLQGKPVPTPEDVANSRVDEEDDEDDGAGQGGSIEDALIEYLKSLSSSKRNALVMRLKDTDFRAKALQVMESAGMLLAIAAVGSDDDLSKVVESAQCLDAAFLADPDLADLSVNQVVGAQDLLLVQLIDNFGGDLSRAQKRGRALTKLLKEKIAPKAKGAKAAKVSKAPASKTAKAPVKKKST